MKNQYWLATTRVTQYMCEPHFRQNLLKEHPADFLLRHMEKDTETEIIHTLEITKTQYNAILKKANQLEEDRDEDADPEETDEEIGTDEDWQEAVKKLVEKSDKKKKKSNLSIPFVDPTKKKGYHPSCEGESDKERKIRLKKESESTLDAIAREALSSCKGGT